MGCVLVGEQRMGAGNDMTCTSKNFSTPNYTMVLVVWFGQPGLFILGNLYVWEFGSHPSKIGSMLTYIPLFAIGAPSE